MKNFIKLSLFTLGTITSSFSIANEISHDFIKKEIQLAHAQYLEGTPESGLYALQALARILESDKSSSELGPNNLSFTYLRIGLLHEKAGNESKAKAYFKKALSTYNGKSIELANLKEEVLKLDEKRS
ncbi:hypothetical protein FIU82_18000 (plasmid) [Pseudoalteromonas sp. THAF3]|uniref:hypothetical protein n=1 Tax=Pseudoalteromonas sp. THAF3 TaxID=2587843 RepID=UPI001268DA0B|nr:hypothetical protein [Pseudoalteromonas sp. THAF3]QFU06891.1 hypothetical protein FIU82_18000 [Pseudoalteromonas sp. THAF3]